MSRRPKPTSLKLLEGTTRPDRDRGPEPEPPEGPIVRPEHVKYRAAELWDQYAPALEAMGTLTVVDVPNFAIWCRLQAKFEEVGVEMSASHLAQLRMIAAGFGMDAAARAKLGAGGGKGQEDPADEFFNVVG